MKQRLSILFVLFLLLTAFVTCTRSGESEHGDPAGHVNVLAFPRHDDENTPKLAPAADRPCLSSDSLTILLDGMQCADPAYLPGDNQPSVIVKLTEPDGRKGVLLVDFGVSPEALENNLTHWFKQHQVADPKGTDGPRRAILVSHAHTYGALMAPFWSFHQWSVSRSLQIAWSFFGDITVRSPNLELLCKDMLEAGTNPTTVKLCTGLAHETPAGLSPVLYSDGTTSQRAWTYSFPIAPEERDHLPFQPYEAVFVFRTENGYFVYGTCSHRLQAGNEPPAGKPLHAVELIQREIDEGNLPPGPIHTLVTGLCGMDQTVRELVESTAASPGKTQQLVRSRLTKMASDTGLQRVYLSHCGLMFDQFWPHFTAIFGSNVMRATPGACIPLNH
jgi:hypothetical protein